MHKFIMYANHSNGLVKIKFSIDDVKSELFNITVEDFTELQWFFDNKSFFLAERFPLDLDVGQSIAEAIDQFYEKNDIDDAIGSEELYEYRVRHGVRFGFRGQDLPDIYIGLGQDGCEISCCDDVVFKYLIDMESLFECLDKLMSSSSAE